MSARLVRPEMALRDLLLARLEASDDCLFAVAYIDRPAVQSLRSTLAERLKRRKFALRVLFRASDLRTDPAALDEILDLGAAGDGTVALRYSLHPKFHAKAYGFRRSKTGPCSVVIGSANLLKGAISTDSGELGVLLENSSSAEEAWGVLDDFWTEGRRVTGAWLKAYRSKHAEAARKAAAAARTTEGWAKSFRRQRRSFPLPDLETEPFHVVSTEPRGAAMHQKVSRAAAAARANEIEIPDGYYTWDEEPLPPRDTNLLELFETGKGLRRVRLVRLGKVVRVVDPYTKERIRLVGMVQARGGRLELRAANHLRNESKLARRGLSWADLEGLSGQPRGRRPRLLAALYALGWPKPRRRRARGPGAAR
jgi:HKD family nuclease